MLSWYSVLYDAQNTAFSWAFSGVQLEHRKTPSLWKVVSKTADLSKRHHFRGIVVFFFRTAKLAAEGLSSLKICPSLTHEEVVANRLASPKNYQAAWEKVKSSDKAMCLLEELFLIRTSTLSAFDLTHTSISHPRSWWLRKSSQPSIFWSSNSPIPPSKVGEPASFQMLIWILPKLVATFSRMESKHLRLSLYESQASCWKYGVLHNI